MIRSSTYKQKGKQFYFEADYLEAIKNFNKAIELEPEDSDSWEFKGRCKYYLDQNKEAIKDLSKSIELDPKKSESWGFRGSCKIDLNQYEGAIKDFDKAIELNPKESQRWEFRGIAHLETIKYELAEKDFKEAYKIDGDKANFNHNIGNIFHKKKEYYFAIKHYLEGLKTDPNNFSIYADMSLSKFALGNHENSLDDLKKSEELFNKNKNTFKEFFSIFDNDDFNKVMKIYESNNDLEKVEEIIRFLSKIHKNNNNQLLLGILYFRKGDFYNAISNLIDVYEVDNKNKACILYLGKAKLALKDYKNALVDFKNYIALEKNEEVEKLIKSCEDKLK